MYVAFDNDVDTMHESNAHAVHSAPDCLLHKTRKPCYRKDDRAMRPIYGRPEKFLESLATSTATFPEIANDCCCDRSYESAPDGQCWGQPVQRP